MYSYQVNVKICSDAEEKALQLRALAVPTVSLGWFAEALSTSSQPPAIPTLGIHLPLQNVHVFKHT